LRLRHNIAKQVLVFPVGKKYVKIFWGIAREKYFTEVDGNTAALLDAKWSSVVVPVEKFGKRALLSKRGKQIETANDIVRYLKLRLSGELKASNKQCAFSILDSSFLSRSCFSLSQIQIENIENYLSLLWLPVGSAHGDLHKDNFILLDGKIKVIDWAMYRTESSFVLDYMHYFCRVFCTANKLSWVDAIWFPIPEWQNLSLQHDAPLESLRLAYAIDRVSLELSQNSNLLFVKLDKYKKLVFQLIDSISG
jgi:hypothetical protein